MRRRGNKQDRDAGPRVVGVCARAFLFAFALGLPASCGTTVDPIGYNSGGGLPLGPLTGPLSYPNPFRDWLGQSDAAIATKIDGAFQQLFHGDPTAMQPIYYALPGTDLASIQDVFHANEVRTEGIGYGMLIAVELDKRDEFDRLWAYAKTSLRVPNGASAGYFNSFCDTDTGTPVVCLDPFGLQQMTMALILAKDRYAGAPEPGVDYEADARDLLTLMRHKQDENGGIVDGVTNTFDPSTSLVLDVPNASAAGIGRPSIEMPAYYDLWKQATGDSFWTAAAQAARGYWQRTANPTTGLTPVRATFAGVSVTDAAVFEAEAYRTQLAVVLDQIWSGGNPWNQEESDRLITFFNGQGIDTYGMSYTLDGATELTMTHDPALVAANGTAAAIATVALRTQFVQKVWDMPIPSGFNRYYSGLLYLHALLVLGGQLRVY